MKTAEKNPFKCLFMNRSLKFRITLLYTIFAVFLVGGITFYTYRFNVELLKEKETLILNDSLEYVKNKINTRITAVNEEYINNFSNTKFMDLYLKNTYLDKASKDFSRQLDLSNQYRDYFFDLRIRNTDLIQSMILVTDNGEVYSDNYNPELGYTAFMHSPYYEEVMSNKNKIIYRNLEPGKDHISILRSFYFTADKDRDSAYPTPGYQSERNKKYSTLIFFLKKSYFRQIIKKEALKRQTGVLFLDQSGNMVVKDGDIEWLTDSGLNNIAALSKDSASGSFEEHIEGKNVGIHYQSIDYMDWKVFYIYDMNILYREAGQIENVVTYIFLFAVLAVFLIATIISHTVVKPIRHLSNSMDEAVDNDLEVSFEPKYNDEIADLSKTFKLLMKRISSLMADRKAIEEQKRTEELKALQAQINPHFLYNTLDTVYWLAMLDDNENIANLISDLAGFFRLSLNKGEDITTVSREVLHVMKYLEIQKVRLSGKFDYEIHLEESLKEKRLPKLILQPFVENSLLHGFEGIKYRGLITVNISEEQDGILFCITDNGKGIEPEVIEKLNRSGKTYKEEEKLGYAIINVCERIRLYAGNKYGVLFDDGFKEGTRVWIRFPEDFQS